VRDLRQGFGLRAKYILTISLLLIVFGATTTVINFRTQRDNIRHRLFEKATGMVAILAASATDPLAILDVSRLRSFLADALEQEEVKYAYVFDSEGRILTDGTRQNRFQDQRFLDPLSVNAVAAESRLIQLEEDVLDVTEPIYLGTSKIGGIRIGFSLQRMHREIADAYSRNLLLGSGFVVLGALVAIVLAQSIMRPVARLIEGTRAVAQGQFETRVAVRTRDQIATLADHFNQMTEQLQRSQAALLFAKDYADNIIRSMADMLIVASPDGFIQRVNAAACALLGYGELELVGQPLLKIMPHDSPAGAAAGDDRIGKGLLFHAETAFRTKDGRDLPVSLSGSPMRRPEGTVQALVYVAQDLTPRKQAEEALARQAVELTRFNAELQAKNADLDSFVYIVSHDLKAPLVTLQGMSSILLEEYGDTLGDEGKHFLQRIQENTRQMESLIMDLLALSRIGREARTPEAVSLADVVDESLVEMAERIRERGITVVRGDLGTVWAIRVQMEQVMGNLLSNAIKYIGNAPFPVVEVGSVDRGDRLEVYVKDNGIGIDPTYHERIFEIFQRLGEVEAEGTGIGLTIVRKIVEAAGGRVWVESAKDQGATFYFTWPKGPQFARGRQSGSAPPPSAERRAPPLPTESHASPAN
jgi:PAS domain S-box-containing protein